MFVVELCVSISNDMCKNIHRSISLQLMLVWFVQFKTRICWMRFNIKELNHSSWIRIYNNIMQFNNKRQLFIKMWIISCFSKILSIRNDNEMQHACWNVFQLKEEATINDMIKKNSLSTAESTFYCFCSILFLNLILLLRKIEPDVIVKCVFRNIVRLATIETNSFPENCYNLPKSGLNTKLQLLWESNFAWFIYYYTFVPKCFYFNWKKNYAFLFVHQNHHMKKYNATQVRTEQSVLVESYFYFNVAQLPFLFDNTNFEWNWKDYQKTCSKMIKGSVFNLVETYRVLSDKSKCIFLCKVYVATKTN